MVTALIIPNASMLRLLRSVGRVVVSQTQDHCECGYGREGTGAEASLSRDHRVEESVRAKVRAFALSVFARVSRKKLLHSCCTIGCK